MKKLFSLLFVVSMILSLCACSEKGISLDLENYEQYLTVETRHFLDGEKNVMNNFSDIMSEISVEGVSTNYIYKDVEIDFRLLALYTVDDDSPESDEFGFSKKAIDRIITVKCNVAGNGEIVDCEPTGGYINNALVEYISCKVEAIRGKVVEN